MRFFSSLAGLVLVELTAADLNLTLDVMLRSGLQVQKMVPCDELTTTLLIRRQDYRKLRNLCAKRGDSLKLIRRTGLYWAGKGLLRRPILGLGLLVTLLFSLWLPGRVLFFQVEGNTTIPNRQILEQASQCGLGFGASRRAVRSERVKNALLEAMPQLQWVGVNTEGCVAHIQVRERVVVNETEDSPSVGHVVAVREGIIQSCTATRGTLLCAPGQAVRAGDLLISGYTDCGIAIRAEQAEGEVFATTWRSMEIKMATDWSIRAKEVATGKKITLLLGKKRINLWKDSGILDTTCDRMYEEYYITLPGGFRLPAAIIVERYTSWEVTRGFISEEGAGRILTDSAGDILQKQMLAGRILREDLVFRTDDQSMTMAGQYICMEMIGKMQRLQIGEENGEKH